MANPRFYWYPNGSVLDTIDLEPAITGKLEFGQRWMATATATKASA